MSIQQINRGTSPNDGNGDTAREGAQKINENFDFLYNGVADFKAVLGPVLATNDLGTNAANVINSQGSFTFPFANLGFIKYIEYVNGDIFNIYFFKITKIGGSASFGVNGTVNLQGENLFLTGQKLKSAEDFGDISTTVTEDFGDIGTTSVIDYVNGLSPALTIQATSVGATILKAIVDGTLVSFLFKGDGGVYGAGELQLVQDDLELINESSSTSVLVENITQIPNRSYNDLQNKPNIPNVSNFETSTQLNTRDTNNRKRSNHTGTQPASTITGLATVATSGSYNDLQDLPDLDTLTTTATTLTFQRNSIHGTKAIPLSSASFDLTDSVVGNVVQVWFQGNILPTATDLYWTDGADEDFEALTLYLLTFNLHPDNVIVGTINKI